MITSLPSNFKGLIRRILNEEVEKSSTNKPIFKRLPEIVNGSDLKKITPHPVENKSKPEILAAITSTVSAIDKTYSVIWDDHDDIRVNAEDLFKIRIIPKWENNYSIEAYTKNEDRIFITGQTLEQVQEFLKDNLKEKESNTEKAYKKSINNYKLDDVKAPDSGTPQKNKPTPKVVGTVKNKEKNYKEEQVKTETDLPNKPMQEVKDIKKQINHKLTQPEKLKKQKPNTTLVIKK